MSASPVSSPDTLSAERAEFRRFDLCRFKWNGDVNLRAYLVDGDDGDVCIVQSASVRGGNQPLIEFRGSGRQITVPPETLTPIQTNGERTAFEHYMAWRKRADEAELEVERLRALLSERPTLSQADADALIFEFEVQSRKRVGADYERARAALRAALLGEKP